MNYEMKLTYFLLFQTTTWLRCCTVWWSGQARVPTCSPCPGPAWPPPPRRRPHPSPGPAARDRSCINFPPRGKSSSCWSMAWWPTVASDFKLIRILHIWYIMSSTVSLKRSYRSLALLDCRVCHLIMMLRTVTELSGHVTGHQCGMRLTCHRQSSHSLIHDHTHIL